MTYKGHVENGQIVLDEAVTLPDGAAVVVELLPNVQTKTLHPEIQLFSGIIPPPVEARSEHRQGYARQTNNCRRDREFDVRKLQDPHDKRPLY